MSTDMESRHWITVRQGNCVDLTSIPWVEPGAFSDHLKQARGRGLRLAQLFGRRESSGGVTLYAFVANDHEGTVGVCGSHLVASDRRPLQYPSIAAHWPAAQVFEREIAEQYGVHPVGHPWLKPLRYHPTDDGSPAPWGPFDRNKPIPGDYPFYRVEGEEVHEVAVGPVHAGVIEPGHFRFQCHGEEVLHLETRSATSTAAPSPFSCIGMRPVRR